MESESNDETDAQASEMPERQAELLVLSARNENALSQLASDYGDFIQQNPSVKLTDLCHTAASGRRHHEHRVALTAKSKDEAIQKLGAVAKGQLESLLGGGSNGSANGSKNGNGANHPPAGMAQGICKSAPKIAWFFDWNQPNDFNSARELFATEPVFREMVREFDERLATHLPQTDEKAFQLQTWLESDDPGSAAIVPVDVRLFVLQAGLAKVWLDWGVEPDAVLGFGVGQYVAACVAGCLCFNDALTLIVERAKVTSNETESAEDELLKQFETFADQFNYYPPNLPLICSLSGDVVAVHRSLGGSYWREHCLAEPTVPQSISALDEMNCDYVLDIGAASSGDIPSRKIAAKNLQSLLPNQHASSSLLSTLGQLYAAGLNPKFVNLGKDLKRNRISLPTYPFQKKRYWITEIDSHVKEKEVATVET